MRTNLLALTAIVRSPVYLSPESCIHFQKWYSAPLKLILSDLSFAVQWIGEAYVPQPYTATNTFVGVLFDFGAYSISCSKSPRLEDGKIDKLSRYPRPSIALYLRIAVFTHY